MDLLVTRPQPAADSTAARLRELGHRVHIAPLLATEPVGWQPPATAEAIMLTSAAAARFAGPGAARFHHLPAHAVGGATARAATAAGFTDVREGSGTAQQLLDSLAGHVLHLAGEDRTNVVLPPGLSLTTAIVYRARLLSLDTIPAVDWVLLYSTRTAAHFATECDRIGAARSGVAIAAISEPALAAAGPGWSGAIAASSPDEDALLAAIAASCQKPPAT